ncbi:Uma2 family endonuclease [Aquisphaera insulae]|uniref:Uma2 family endonuclease n=1 Tax=Aquisphaera insulae TaxID=2712864 RepID=UPI0013EBC62E|nr:Uma2 family endonuclease [Aquisphaera insulae]
MATVEDLEKSQDPGDDQPPPLENGDQLSRAEFERRYEAMPGLKKAELIEGIVFMPSPVRFRQHSEPDSRVNWWLQNYAIATLGILSGQGASIRLDLDNEPQADAVLMIAPEHGGQASFSPDDYIEGAPELVAEISASTVSMDLNLKFHVYLRNGVREYIVWRIRDRAIDWFVRRDADYVRLEPDAEGCYRSVTFPGLWLDPKALVSGDMARVKIMAEQGLASPEHADFVRKLAERVIR